MQVGVNAPGTPKIITDLFFNSSDRKTFDVMPFSIIGTSILGIILF